MSDGTIKLLTTMARKRVLKMAYNKSVTDGRKIPAIKFSGDYLSALGFKSDGKFAVIINDDLSITIIPDATEDEQKA